MTVSTTKAIRVKRIFIKAGKKAAVAAFWLLLWQGIYLLVQKEILIASPLATARRIIELCGTAEFWRITGGSLLRILCGFLSGLLIGTALATLSAAMPFLHALFRPLVGIAKATPVASFIILALCWIGTGKVPAFIAALMVFPILFGNVYEGIRTTPADLLEMGGSFCLSRKTVFLQIYLPHVFPYFLAGTTTALGLAWKAGIAAEVLSTPRDSIGLMLHNAKIYIETVDLFAWTVVVILLSMLLERLLVLLLGRLTFHVPLRRSTAPAANRQPAAASYAVSGISKRFGDNRVLDDTSVTLPAGVTALMGPSGSGKTTLLRILTGLERSDAPVKGAFCRRPAVLFQEDRLLETATVAENIRLVNPAADVSGLLRDMELEGTAELYPKDLSGGMRRRVALARTLGYTGDAVFLDEPFKGLDAELKERVAARTFSRLRGCPVLLVTHDAEEAVRFADRILRLSNGKVVEATESNPDAKDGEQK